MNFLVCTFQTEMKEMEWGWGWGNRRKADLPSFRKFAMDKLWFELMPQKFSNRGMEE